jgi:sugar porter (SP) family MFS transporter
MHGRCFQPAFSFSQQLLNKQKMMEDVNIDSPRNPPGTGAGVNNSNNRTHEGEYHGDQHGGLIPITRSTYTFVLCAAINSCNLGYDIGVGTDAARLIQADLGLSRTLCFHKRNKHCWILRFSHLLFRRPCVQTIGKQREIFVASLNFWAMFGALGAQYCTDHFGRRRTFIVAAVGFLLGIIIMVFSNSYPVLLLGRGIVGLGVGVGLAIDPLYIAEVTPAKHRGELVTWSEIALNVGIVLGFSTGLFFSNVNDSLEWRIMFALGGILPCIMIGLVLKVMPESPRWLVSKNRQDEARNILQLIYPPGFDVEPVIRDINEAIERDAAAEKAIGWGILLHPTPAIRRSLLVGVGTAIAQQAVGIDAIQYYLLDVIEDSGIESQEKQSFILILLGLLKLAFIFVGGKYFDRRGRRPLFFISLLGMAAALFVVSMAFVIDDKLSSGATIVGLALYLSFFSVGMGPGAWLVPAETFSTCIRAKAMSVATVLNRATATLMSSTFLSTANAIGWASFFMLLCLISLLVCAFLYIYLPETKGRSLEEMTVYFAEITGDSTVLEAEAEIRQRQQSTEMSNVGGNLRAQSRDAEVI